MKSIIFVLVLTVGVLGRIWCQQPNGLEDVVNRLFTVESAHSFYQQGEGALMWLEDLQVIEESWKEILPGEKEEIRALLLPLYMQESMGFSLFEEESDWLPVAEAILFGEE